MREVGFEGGRARFKDENSGYKDLKPFHLRKLMVRGVLGFDEAKHDGILRSCISRTS